MINCKVELKLTWTKYCVLIELKLNWATYCVLNAAGNDNANDNPDNIIFTIKDTILFVPVATLSAKNNQKL